MFQMILRLIRPIALAVLLTFVLLTLPAQACGCGGYVPRDGDAQVTQERALLRWDGRTEDIVMALNVQGSSNEAAWILPVPSRAQVKLSDAKIIDELQGLTKPLIKEERTIRALGGAMGAAPPGAGAPVTVLERRTLGPFDVSNLAASDANALSEWLKTNGYQFAPALANVLQPYIAQNWYFVAVRLTPGAQGQKLDGALDPLWVTFASDQLVYPMRASANAKNTQTVTLYLLAPHRVEKQQSFGDSHIAFADWVEPSSLRANSTLAPFITQKIFLTKFVEQVAPSRVNDDFVFTFAANDETYRDIQTVQVVDDNLTLAFYGGILFVVLCIPLLIAFGAIFLIVRLVRRRRQPPQPA
jgi:hypothetical protein